MQQKVLKQMSSAVALDREAQMGQDSFIFTPFQNKSIPLRITGVYLVGGWVGFFCCFFLGGECSKRVQNTRKLSSKSKAKSHGHSATHTEIPHNPFAS